MSNENQNSQSQDKGNDYRKPNLKKQEKELKEKRLENLLGGIRKNVAKKDPLQRMKTFKRAMTKAVLVKPSLDSKGKLIYGSDKSQNNKSSKKKKEVVADE